VRRLRRRPMTRQYDLDYDDDVRRAMKTTTTTTTIIKHNCSPNSFKFLSFIRSTAVRCGVLPVFFSNDLVIWLRLSGILSVFSWSISFQMLRFFWNPLLFRRSDAPTRAKWHLSGEWEQFRPNDLPVAVNDSWQLESTADFSGWVLYFNQVLPTVLLKEPYKKPDV